MAEELKFYKWSRNAQSNFFFCPEFYHVDFSRGAGDFSFKLVASSRILVAMATKVVATWKVAYAKVFFCFWLKNVLIDLKHFIQRF